MNDDHTQTHIATNRSRHGPPTRPVAKPCNPPPAACGTRWDVGAELERARDPTLESREVRGMAPLSPRRAVLHRAPPGAISPLYLLTNPNHLTTAFVFVACSSSCSARFRFYPCDAALPVDGGSRPTRHAMEQDDGGILCVWSCDHGGWETSIPRHGQSGETTRPDRDRKSRTGKA